MEKNRITELRDIQLCGNMRSERLWGEIELTHLAKPETVKVIFQEEELIPEKFNIFGAPIFTEEMTKLYTAKVRQIRRKTKQSVKAEISYEKQEMEFQREEFDSVKGIEESLQDVESFNEMLNKRKLWKKVHNKEDKNAKLKEFVIWGKYKLDNYNWLSVLNDNETNNTNIVTVYEYEESSKKECKDIIEEILFIPKVGATCPCCGKQITMQDLKIGDITEKSICSEGYDFKIYHKSCFKNYCIQQEIDDKIDYIFDHLYDKDFEYELLPNGYDPEDERPWFLCHTPDGDIIIGATTEEEMSIEWQENFKPFDFSIFNKNYTLKWYGDKKYYKRIRKGKSPKNVKRGIHARNLTEAKLYMNNVKNNIS